MWKKNNCHFKIWITETKDKKVQNLYVLIRLPCFKSYVQKINTIGAIQLGGDYWTTLGKVTAPAQFLVFVIVNLPIYFPAVY
jgi:hypothetical protein